MPFSLICVSKQMRNKIHESAEMKISALLLIKLTGKQGLGVQPLGFSWVIMIRFGASARKLKRTVA